MAVQAALRGTVLYVRMTVTVNTVLYSTVRPGLARARPGDVDWIESILGYRSDTRDLTGGSRFGSVSTDPVVRFSRLSTVSYAVAPWDGGPNCV